MTERCGEGAGRGTTCSAALTWYHAAQHADCGHAGLNGSGQLRVLQDVVCTEFPAAWPGESGRVILSGHRTTYGAPFYDLDRLEPGDEIIIEAKWGDSRFVYEVTDDRIVSPHSSEIVTPGVEPELVLTTCNPRFSAAERLVVFSRLVRT